MKHEDLRDIKVLERAILDKEYIYEALKCAKLKNGDHVLDLGCGCGGSTKVLWEYNHELNIVGVDIDPKKIEYAKRYRKEKVEYIIGDARKLDFCDKQFDVIFARMLFEVCNKPEEIVKEMHRILKNEGVIIIMGNISTTPFIFPSPSFYGKYRVAEERILQKMKNTIYNPLELVTILKNENMTIVKFKPYFKDSINYGNFNLLKYYQEDEKNDNLLVKASLMKEEEYKAFTESFNKLMQQENTIALYSQYYIISKLKKG